MKINDYVLVTNSVSALYKRRCKVVRVVNGDGVEKLVVYSKGLEEQDSLLFADCELSKF